MSTIYFDMDGTLAGLFFVKNFSEMLNNGNMQPYTTAKPLYNVEEMNAVIFQLVKKGYNIGIISYVDNEYMTDAKKAKMNWLKNYFPFANIENIHIVTKETSKADFYKKGDILVDDAKANRTEWENKGGKTINAYFRNSIKMIDALRELI